MQRTFLLILLTTVNARKLRKDLPTPLKQESYEDDNKDVNEVKHREYQHPVIFSHLHRDGFGDTNFKQPFDALDLDMVKPRDDKHALELLQKSDRKNIQIVTKRIPLIFLSPRDEMEYFKRFYNKTDVTDKQKLKVDQSKVSSNPNYDFASTLDRNFANPFAGRVKTFQFPSNKKSLAHDVMLQQPKRDNISDFFEDNRFYRKPDPNRYKINWTTCDEFASKAVFHPNDVVNTKWLPFFMWSKRELSRTVIHTFSYPTKKSVQYFKTTYGPHLKDINWREPKLLLKERRSLLLIAGDRKGLFYGIPDQELPQHPMFKNITIRVIKLRMKIVDPYLAMMYCDENYAAIMAELGNEPTSEHKAIQEAGTLRFRGKGTPVYRDIVEEKFLENLEKERKKDYQPKKMIRIHKIIGDVDERVKH